MAKTSAIRQREYRQRHARRLVALETEAAILRRDLVAARAALEDANTEIQRLAGMVCKHPSGAVSDGRCQACGTDVW